ncbi:MAG: histone deacetylase [Anaerolineae bacterium]
MTTAYVYDPLYLEHNRSSHVERRERLETTTEVLQAAGLLDRLVHVEATPVPMEHLLEVHPRHYVNQVKEVADRGGGNLDPDTYLNARSYEVALLAAGGMLNLVQAVLDGQVKNGFALVRPPGHHALPSRAMGFCLFNNVAVAAKYALRHKGLSRILIADFDLHHGNSTQDVFYDTGEVFYFSTHQYPYYPGSGHWSDVGRGSGEGFTVNVPLPPGVDDDGYGRIFDEILYPIADRYRPELILVSAGYDAHWADPLGMMQLSVAGYAYLTRVLKEMAEEFCDGRLAFTLEGGYDLQALAHSVAATLQGLLGDEIDDPLGPSPRPGVSVDDIIVHIKGLHRLL